MRNKLFLIMSILVFMTVTACSDEDKPTPNDHFEQFSQVWMDKDFSKLYGLITTDAREKYGPEDVIDRFDKIYKDLNISDLEITYEALSEEAIEKAEDDGSTVIPFTLSMNSIAGPIEFAYEATMIRKENEEEYRWDIDWDPGFIFPALKDGGEIQIQSDQPMRGEIIDRNQMPLAINDYIYEVGIVPQGLEEQPEKQKKEIASLLHISVESIDTALAANWVEPDLFVPLKKVPKTEEKAITELREINAVMIQEVMGRIYPLHEAAAHLIGYIGPITAEELENQEDDLYGAHDVIGKRGLEQIYEKQLKGERGIKIIAVTDENDLETIAAKEAKDGETIQLTIDVNIQEEVYKSYEEDSGTATAIHPKTGETLALVSSPSFNPNDFLYGMTSEKLATLENDPKKPIINRFSATFSPGSVIKPITAAIGLQNETIDPSEGLEIEGLTWSNGEGWGDYKVRRVSETNEPVDLADALIRSDNIYFAMKAVEMGGEKLKNGFQQFGFTEPIPFAYPITRSSIANNNELTGEVNIANTSYGQAEIEMSTLHMATAYTTFLNEGNMLKPTLLTTEATEEIWQENLISSEQAQIINQTLREVVRQGTATIANTDELAISGKTGTAELKVSIDAKGEENGWFIGYPTEEEDLLIAMMIENVAKKGTSAYVAEKVANLLIELQDS